MHAYCRLSGSCRDICFAMSKGKDMITLYHHGSSVCAAKVRMALKEKAIPWNEKYVDIHKSEQFDPEFLKLNPKAVVPVLVHDHTVVTESTLIIEYLEEVFPENPIFPKSASGKVQVRKFTKAVDEELHPACAAITFIMALRYTLRERLSPEDLEAFLSSTPEFSITPFWKRQKREYVEQGFDAPDARDMIRIYDRNIQKVNDGLDSDDWLVENTFSAADIAFVPYVNRLENLGLQGLWENGRMPALEKWWTRIKERSSFQSEIVDWMPEHLLSDFATHGPKGWPRVQEMVGITTL